MLLWLNEDNKISAWNELISFEDAQQYIGKNGCVWHDGTFPEVEDKEGYRPVFFYENGEITWEYEAVTEPVEPEPSQLDRIEEAVNKSHEEIKNEAIDEYTSMLMEEGVI